MRTNTAVPQAALPLAAFFSAAFFSAAVPLAAFFSAAAPLAAQDSVPAPASVNADAGAVEAPKKKKGLFGKVKGLASNKTIQGVAKAAACTMVPGGQYVAGAIDAASSAADGNAGGAAAGAAGAATGANCFGMGGAGGGAAGLGSSAAAAGVDMAATAAASSMNSRFGGAAPGAEPGPGTAGGQFVLTEKQEKAFIKQMKKAGLSEEEAREQLAVYKQQMSAVSAPDDD